MLRLILTVIKAGFKWISAKKSYINVGGDAAEEGVVRMKKLLVYPMFGERFRKYIHQYRITCKRATCYRSSFVLYLQKFNKM